MTNNANQAEHHRIPKLPKIKSSQPILIFLNTHNPEVKRAQLDTGYIEVHSTGIIIGISGHKIGYINRDGYRGVCLLIEGKYYHYLVHRIIARAFLDNPDGLPEVGHKLNNKLDNRVSQLEWLTSAQNIEDAFKTGVHNNPRIPIMGTSIKTAEIIVFSSMCEAGNNGFNQSHICKCINGKRKSHHGFTWKKIA